MGKLHADLVRAPRVQMDFDKRVSAADAERAIRKPRELRPRRSLRNDAGRIRALVLPKPVAKRAVFFDRARDHGKIRPRHLPRLQLRRQPRRRLGRARECHDAARRTVEPMHEPEVYVPGLVVFFLDIGLQNRQKVGIAAGIRLRGHVLRLLDDQKVVVFIENGNHRRHFPTKRPAAPQGSTSPRSVGRQTSCASTRPL